MGLLRKIDQSTPGNSQVRSGYVTYVGMSVKMDLIRSEAFLLTVVLRIIYLKVKGKGHPLALF